MTNRRKIVTAPDADTSEYLGLMAAGHRRPALSRALDRPSPALWALLNATSADGPHGCALATRLWPAPDEMWLGWRPGFGKTVVTLWAPDQPRAHPPDLPGLPPVLAAGPGWMVRPWMGGRSLVRALRAPMSAPTAWNLIEALEETVEALHRAGQAHGALCPANVLLPPGHARPMLIDWGISPLEARDWSEGDNAFRRDRHALARLTAQILTGRPL